MKVSRLAFPLLLVAFLSAGAALRAQDIDLVGSVGWRQFGRAIHIHAERIENNLGSGTSGFLRLQIWATTNVYDGVSDISGYVIGTFNLGLLDAGSAFVNAARIVRYFRPPPGLYYTTITLEEQQSDSSFLIVDSENFDGIVNFGGFGQGSANVGSNGDVGFVGDVSWYAANGRVQLFVEQILNERASGRSGVLRIRLWATTTPYMGEPTLQGFPMATKRVGRVGAGFFIANFSRYVFFRPPPEGEYYVTMTLEEFAQGGWNIVDYITFDGTSIF